MIGKNTQKSNDAFVNFVNFEPMQKRGRMLL